ncbi:right-handed parallel beta-helix repeat-containing protein [Desulforhopalus sp. 52FAK]
MNISNKAFVIATILLAHVAGVALAAEERIGYTRTKLQMSFPEVNSSVIYVRQNATSINPDGQSWATAYTSLGDALASDLTDKSEIWVSRGVYYPSGDVEREATFSLVSGIGVYGGFKGTEVRKEQRNWLKNTTILSGEIGDQSVLTDNVYHVVTGADDAVLDGFIIRDGYAILGESETDNSGCLVTVPDEFSDLESLRIVTNTKKSSGGGLLNVHTGTITKNCFFTNNYATKGGAVYNMVTQSWDPGSNAGTVIGDAPIFENCIFESNHATDRGGAMNNEFFTKITISNSVFSKNVCDAKGGAIYSDMGSPASIINVLFYKNEAERGGALVADGVSPHRLAYTTFANNKAYDIGSALYQGALMGLTGDGEPYVGNEVHVYKSIIIANDSGSATTSISNWHDGIAMFDEESLVETTEGTVDTEDYFKEDSYIPQKVLIGWHPGRKADVDYWADYFLNDPNRTYTAYSYNTMSSEGAASRIFVKYDAGGLGDGTSWDNAYTKLSDALENATPGSDIWVAAGTYKPTSGTDRSETFVMKEGVYIYGGFAGTETDLEARDYAANITILSGDIGTVGDNSDNVYHVLFGASNATLDGFTIQDGYADGNFHHSRGAGMLCYNSASPTIVNCNFQNNSGIEGGAIASYSNSAPAISNCTFINNSAEIGGALLFRSGPDSEESGPQIIDTIFSNNIAQDRGGAVYVDYGAWPSFTNCELTENESYGSGGAVYIDNNTSQLSPIQARFVGCDFSNNSSSLRGGGIEVYEGTLFLEETSIHNNSAKTGGGGVALDYMGHYVNVSGSSSVADNSSIKGESNMDDAADTDQLMPRVVAK